MEQEWQSTLASENCDYKIKDLTNMCDIFYLGGTKAGFLFESASSCQKKKQDLKKNMDKL